MDAIPKFIASAFVTIMAIFIGLSLIMCGMSVSSARTYYSSVADAISSVDAVHEDAMIEECTLLAEQNGYILKTEKKSTIDDKYYYELILEYEFAAPFFGTFQNGTVSGYVYPGSHVNKNFS